MAFRFLVPAVIDRSKLWFGHQIKVCRLVGDTRSRLFRFIICRTGTLLRRKHAPKEHSFAHQMITT